MNFSILNVALFGAGALLIASAIKGKSPQQIIAESVGGVKKPAAGTSADDTADEGNRGRARDYERASTGIQPMAPAVVTSP